MSNVGVRGFKYALLSQDDEKGVKYGDFIAIPGLNKIDVKPNSQSATNYGDNAPMETATALGDVTISLDLISLPSKDQAALLGHSVNADGEQVFSGNDVAPYVAVMFSGLAAAGKEKHVKVLKIRFQESDDSFETKDNNVKFHNPQLTGKAVVRTFDGQWKRTLDENDTAVTADKVTAFKASVEKTA